jgi:hypothetical protein
MNNIIMNSCNRSIQMERWLKFKLLNFNKWILICNKKKKKMKKKEKLISNLFYCIQVKERINNLLLLFQVFVVVVVQIKIQNDN